MSLEHFHYVFMSILPVFLVIGLGYFAFKKKWLPEGGHKTLAAFVFNFGLPAAIFSALSIKSLDEMWNTDYVILYTLGSLVAFTIVAVYGFWVLKRNAVESVILGLGGSFSNSLLIGFPIISFLFGSAALVPFSLTLIVENLIMLPLLLGMADMAGSQTQTKVKDKLKETLKNLVKNPIILAIGAGVIVSAMSLHPPETASRMIEMLANTVTGIALFTIGGGLVGVKMKGMKKEIGTVMLAKLFVHPMVILGMSLVWFELQPTMSAVAVILASMPMFGVYAVIGQKYNMGGLCSAVILPTIIFAIVTVSIMTTVALMTFNVL
jgi:malonate transporter